MPRPAAKTPAEIDRVVSRSVREAERAVADALREVTVAGTPKARRVARHLTGVLRMLRDTGSVVSPYDPPTEERVVKVARKAPAPVPTPTVTPPEVEAQDE